MPGHKENEEHHWDKGGNKQKSHNAMQEYEDLKQAVSSLMRDYGMSWTTFPDFGIGPHHQGLSILLNWKAKGSKHFYNFVR